MKKFDYLLMWGWLAFVCNMVILILSNTRYGGCIFESRYHIFTMLPLLIIVPKYLEQVKFSNVLPQTILAGVAFCVLMINVVHYRDYYTRNNNYDSIEQVVAIAKEQQADVLVVLGEDMIATGRVARLCEADMPVIMYNTWGMLHGWGDCTLRLEDYSEMQNYVILTQQAGYDGVADEIKSTWSLYSIMGDWQIYFGTY